MALTCLFEHAAFQIRSHPETGFAFEGVEQRSDGGNHASVFGAQQQAEQTDHAQAASDRHGAAGGFVHEQVIRVQFLGEDDGLGFALIERIVSECLGAGRIFRGLLAD